MGGRVVDPPRSVRAFYCTWRWKLTAELVADSSLPGVRQMVRAEKVGEDSQAARMSLWLQNVESKFFFSSLFD